jgi:hypothetical protein
MAKNLFDQDALISAFENATAKQSTQLRQAVHTATLQALQGREMTLKNVRAAVKSVAEAASTGAARNLNPGIDVESLLDKAVAGMDDALLKAVEAHRAALQQLTGQGADLREKHLQKALEDLENFEDSMVAALKKAASGAAGAPLGEAWGQVLQRMQQAGGSAAGAQAAATVEQMMDQMHSAVRSSRAAGMRAAQALAESYSAMVSGVLIGMSQALQQSPAPAKTTGSAGRKAK